jgi:hypothetical protein
MFIFNYPAMMVIVDQLSKDFLLRFVMNKFGVPKVPEVPKVPKVPGEPGIIRMYLEKC